MKASIWFIVLTIIAFVMGFVDQTAAALLGGVALLIAIAGGLRLLENIHAQGEESSQEIPRLLTEISDLLAQVAAGQDRHTPNPTQERANMVKILRGHAPSTLPAAPSLSKIRCPDCATEYAPPPRGSRANCPTCGVALDIVS